MTNSGPSDTGRSPPEEIIMHRIAMYGKGGIGKSTIASNLSIAFHRLGAQVMQVGCDPKADSTYLLTGGKELTPILSLVRDKGPGVPLSLMVTKGEEGVWCAEAGGPPPGMGCAGRGIVAALQELDKADAYGKLSIDAVVYDVLGDVVCGGFSMPIRDGYADSVVIVTSGERMAMHAAKNIAEAVDHFKDRGYARLAGIIVNKRNVPDEERKTEELAKSLGTVILGVLPFSRDVQVAEEKHLPVLSDNPSSPVSVELMAIARRLYGQA